MGGINGEWGKDGKDFPFEIIDHMDALFHAEVLIFEEIDAARLEERLQIIEETAVLAVKLIAEDLADSGEG